MTFIPKTGTIKKLSEMYPERIQNLENIFSGNIGVYIDYANVRPWSTKLGWNIELKRLYQFLMSFDNMSSIKIYDGVLIGDKISEKRGKEIKRIFKDGYKTKPVKIMKQSIDYTSIKSSATDLLEKFIRRCLLRKYEIETVEYLNLKFKEMNQKGVTFIEDLKCNFDVEIGRDMLLDYERNNIDTFILWSGDSDFYDPIKQLLDDGKKVVLFGTVRRIATELNELQKYGLLIFDIQKIRNFICWRKQINPKRKKDPEKDL